MSLHFAEAVIDSQGRLVLDHLPFQPGDKVEVVLSSKSPKTPTVDLRGSVHFYQNPFEPVDHDRRESELWS